MKPTTTYDAKVASLLLLLMLLAPRMLTCAAGEAQDAREPAPGAHVAHASPTAAPRRLYGSGYIYPAWKGLSGTAAARWEAASLDALVGMGATVTGYVAWD